jgi:hypothetical protein
VKLGLILILVAILLPTVAWLLWGQGDHLVFSEGQPGDMPGTRRYGSLVYSKESGWQPAPTEGRVAVPLRPVLAGALVLVGVGLLVSRSQRTQPPVDSASSTQDTAKKGAS